MRLVLVRFLETYFRHRWLHWFPLLAALTVFGVSLRTTKESYTAQGSIWVERQPLLAALTSSTATNTSWTSPADTTVAEGKELMQTDAFARALMQGTPLEAELTKGPDAMQQAFADVRKWVWWSAVGDNVVMVNAIHERPDVAQQLAASTIKAYLNWHANSDKQEGQVAQSFFNDLVTQYTKELTDANAALEAYLQSHPDPVRGNRPALEQLQIDKLTSVAKDAADRLSKARINQESTRLQLTQVDNNVSQKYVAIDQPTLPTKSDVSRKKIALNGLIFVAAGLLVSILGITGAMLLDSTLIFPSEIQVHLGLPALAIVPGATTGKRSSKRRKPKGQPT